MQSPGKSFNGVLQKVPSRMSPTTESISLDSDMKDSIVADDESAPVQSHPLPLFPLRPCSAVPKSDTTRERKLGVQNADVKKDLHAKTYTPETPSTVVAPKSLVGP